MIVGVPKEVKNHEYRVAMVPAGVKSLVEDGHTVLIQASAGEGSGISDAEYTGAGAQIRPTAEAVYAEADMIVKVKEPLPQEYPLLRKDQILFTYLHLAPAPELTKALLDRGVIGIAYETVQLDNGSLPLLTPMSEVAGRLSIQVAAHWLQKENGGSGVLLGGVPGTPPANVAIIGGGTVGINAAKMALGMGAHVTILDLSLDRLRYLDDVLGGRLTVLASNDLNVEKAVVEADVVVGALLIPGAKAKKVVTKVLDVADAQRLGRRRRGHRPGRMRGGRGPDHPPGPGHKDRRRHAVLRGQHARLRGPHVHVRADQRDVPLCVETREPGVQGGLEGRPGSGQGAERPAGQARCRKRWPKASAWTIRRTKSKIVRTRRCSCPRAERMGGR